MEKKLFEKYFVDAIELFGDSRNIFSSCCGKTRYREGVRTFVYQTQEKGCGFATVKMALIHASRRRAYAYLEEPRADSAPDIATLLDYARKHGLHMRAFKTPSPEELLTAAEFPVILVLREEGPLHMVYVASRRGRRFHVLDPKRGSSWVKGERLAGAFTGIYLKIESYEEGGDDVSRLGRRPVPLFGSALPTILAFLPMAFMSLGLVLLDYSFPPWAVLTAFLATIGASICQRWHLLASMRRFDKRYLCGIDEPFLRQRKALYVHYHAFKRAAFVSRGEVLGHFATIAAAFLLFFLHDIYLAASCGIGFALLCLIHLLFSPSISRLERAAEEDEERYLHGSLGEMARQDTLAALSSRAERYGRILGAKEVGLFLLALALSSFACYCASAFALQPFLFDFLSICFFLFEGERVFRLEPLLGEKEKEETYFRVHILPRVLERRGKG